MKKLLILVLVLGLASVSNAAITYEIRDGGSVVSDLNEGGTYTLVAMGVDGDEAFLGGLYGFSNVGLSSPGVGANNGDLGFNNYIAAYSGYDWGADESGSGTLVTTGDWATWQLDVTGSDGDTYSIGVYDYSISYYTPVGYVTGNIVPEPMTIVLLGLGGLLLRRK